MGKRMQYRIKVLRKLGLYAEGVKRYWVLFLLFSLITTSLNFAAPAVYRLFIDAVILEADYRNAKSDKRKYFFFRD